jgi:hypothetical protein
VNETVFMLPIVLAAIAIFYHYRAGDTKVSKDVGVCVAVFVLIFAAFPLLWQVRSAYLLEPDVPRSSQRALATASHGAYPGFVYESDKYKYFPHLEDPAQPAFSASWKNFVQILSQRFKAQPGRYLRWYLLEKPYYLWSWNMLQGQGLYIYRVQDSIYERSFFAKASVILAKYIHFALLSMALVGIPLCFMGQMRAQPGRTGSLALVLLATCTYFTFIYMIFAPWPRYSIPLRPVLYVWACWCLTHLIVPQIDKIKARGISPKR